MRPQIERLFAENFEVYGAHKVWRQMVREGFAVARGTVERLMQGMGLAGVIRGKPVRTTISDKSAPRPPSAASVTAMTPHAPRRSTASARPRASIGGGLGD